MMRVASLFSLSFLAAAFVDNGVGAFTPVGRPAVRPQMAEQVALNYQSEFVQLDDEQLFAVARKVAERYLEEKREREFDARLREVVIEVAEKHFAEKRTKEIRAKQSQLPSTPVDWDRLEEIAIQIAKQHLAEKERQRDVRLEGLQPVQPTFSY